MRGVEVATHAIVLTLLVLLAITNVYYPQYTFMTLLAFIGFITIVVYTGYRTSRKPPKLFDVVAEEVKRGDVLLEVDNEEVSKLLEKDFILMDEIRKQSTKSLIESSGILLVFGWYFLFFYFILPRFVDAEATTRFIVYLIGYLVPYIGYVATDLIPRRAGRTVTYVLRGYEVYDTGIVSSSQYIVIKFPLSKEYVAVEHSKRKCVELSKKIKGYNVRFLLYTKNISKLTEIINNYGKVELIPR
ncbi:MAG: DUF2208 domain-containing protein [Sulfolobales archaeon]|nr:DUF2208 domain-containing protein [Sulfolobales archaeon]